MAARSTDSSIYNRLNLARRHIQSSYRGRRDKALFTEVRVFCLFIGHARSGGSLISTMLDAHPNAIVADEEDALWHISAGFRRDQLYSQLLHRSSQQARGRRVNARPEGMERIGGPNYLVPGQWQGRFERLYVIGDNRAGKTVQRLAQNPQLLDQLVSTIGNVSLKVIHVIRNPYDVISAMWLRSGRALENGSAVYFSYCDTISELRHRIPGSDIFRVRYEDFVDRPAGWLENLCGFLGLTTTPDYLQACIGILRAAPLVHRHEAPWNTALVEAVQAQIEQYPFLDGYTYGDWGQRLAG